MADFAYWNWTVTREIFREIYNAHDSRFPISVTMTMANQLPTKFGPEATLRQIELLIEAGVLTGDPDVTHVRSNCTGSATITGWTEVGLRLAMLIMDNYVWDLNKDTLPTYPFMSLSILSTLCEMLEPDKKEAEALNKQDRSNEGVS